MGSGVTRRTLLTRSGMALAAVAAGSTGAVELLRRASGPARLSAARRRTYVALVDTVGRGSRSQVDPARAPAAAGWLREDYAGALDPTRSAIDDLLDRIEKAPGTRPFSLLDPSARLASLRALAAGPGDRERDLAGRAVALAAAPFHPPADDFHPTPVTL